MFSRISKSAQNVGSWKIVAYLFLAFSITSTVRILHSLPAYELEAASFFCAGIIVFSVCRFVGVIHPFPAPEFAAILAAVLKTKFMSSLTVPALDEILVSFDRNYGYAETVVGRMFCQSPVLDSVCRFLYYGLMLAIPLTYAVMPNIIARKRFAGATVLAGVLILPMYVLCPGAGPLYLLGGKFPDLAQPHVTISHQILNTTPSGHFAWAILMFWFARKYCGKVVQTATGSFMVAMCLATLGMGEHYVIDLVLSVPFAAGVWALVHRQWKFAWISILVVLIWLIALREEWALAIPPVLVWILTGMTVAGFTLYETTHWVGSRLCWPGSPRELRCSFRQKEWTGREPHPRLSL